MQAHIGLIRLLVADYNAAILYYTSMLGFELIEDIAQPGGDRWVVIAPNQQSSTRLLLSIADTEGDKLAVGKQAGDQVFLFLNTADFQQDYSDMKEKGVKFLEEPRYEAYGTVAKFVDLYGNKWDLIEPKK